MIAPAIWRDVCGARSTARKSRRRDPTDQVFPNILSFHRRRVAGCGAPPTHFYLLFENSSRQVSVYGRWISKYGDGRIDGRG
jgi:hypothetical protein